ncbi:MAG: flagellar assembly protein FliW [Candidatus Kapabacteria bacterium]|nr:flagellar assembly protein FliW [Candidatus Kapabacteria bacterium]
MDSGKSIKIKNSQFGEITVSDDLIFDFTNGILGFEHLNKFVLISDEGTEPFKWLLSIDNPEIVFPLLNPWQIDINYDIGKEFNQERDAVMVIVTLSDDDGSMTANMKAPIILDVVDQTGKQIILPSDKYSTNLIITKKSNE